MTINIKQAPAEFQDYLAIGDREGNNNGAVENRKEAWIAAREYCHSKPGSCDKMIDYMSDCGHYFSQISPDSDEMPPAPKYTPPLPANYSARYYFFRYRGSEKKPIIEFNWGVAVGAGLYKVGPLYSSAWQTTFNPMIELDYNISERARGSYETGYITVDGSQGFALHSFEHKLGASYDVLHHWPKRTRRGGAELHLGGGLLLKSIFLSRGDDARNSINYGAYVIAEAGTVMLWGRFSPQPIQQGWTKLFLSFSTSRGDDVTDYIVLAGGKYCFEGYDEPPPGKKKSRH